MDNRTAIQYMGLIMRQTKLDMQNVLGMVEIINNSYLSAKDIVTILEEIFKNEKSSKIVVAVQVLEFLIKNCNRNFHQAANRESFQKSVLGLLKRLRGKSNLIKDLRSNTQNWSRIESKILYLIQLWYDAFILEQSKYPHIINNYKILRKENVIFPPRNTNEKSLLAIKTESPIFDNIETIAESDKEKFKKRLRAMGLTELSEKFQKKEAQQKFTASTAKRDINIDEISQKMAIIKSQDYEAADALKIIEQIKDAVKYGKVKATEQQYWEELKDAAEVMIQEWEDKNAELIKKEEEKYLELKMGKINSQPEKNQLCPESPQKQTPKSVPKNSINNNVFDLLDDFQASQKQQEPAEEDTKDKPNQEFNLLDL